MSHLLQAVNEQDPQAVRDAYREARERACIIKCQIEDVLADPSTPAATKAHYRGRLRIARCVIEAMLSD